MLKTDAQDYIPNNLLHLDSVRINDNGRFLPSLFLGTVKYPLTSSPSLAVNEIGSIGDISSLFIHGLDFAMKAIRLYFYQ